MIQKNKMKHLKLFENDINMKDFDYEEHDFSLEDFLVERTDIETVYTWDVKLGKYDLKYKLVRDYEGFTHLTLENENEISDDDLLEFLDENENHIINILMDNV